MYGKAGHGEVKPRNLEEPKTCTECGMQNPTGYRFCFHCNAVLDKEQQKLIENHKYARNALNLIAKDTDLARKFSLLIDEVFKKQRDKHAA
jgi:predicted nucleic acid-binding Zn ribbon protein